MTDPAIWLSRAAAEPVKALNEWRAAEVINLPVGIKWDVVEVELRLASRAVGELKRLKEHVGAHLVSGAERRTWWLLPLRSSRLFDGVPGAVVHEPGSPLLAPLPGRYRAHRVWILPEEIRQLTEPTALRDALRAAVADIGPF